MKRPKVITKCVAQQYAAPGERIIEFNSDNGGGLIMMYEWGDELRVDLYHLDKTVKVTIENRQED